MHKRKRETKSDIREIVSKKDNSTRLMNVDGQLNEGSSVEKKAILGGKILIVEDDQFLSSIAAERLEKEGYKVFVVSNGAEAMRRIEEEIPDVVLLDMIMPGMTGFEILKAIKSDKRYKNVSVVIFSNVQQGNEIEESRKLGADGFWIKAEFTPKELVGKIQALLQTKKVL